MARPSHFIRQNDFSSGALVEHAKRRDDEAIVRAGLRQAENCRIISAGGIENRHGRSMLYQDGERVDRVAMTPDDVFDLCFGNGHVRIRNSAGKVVAANGGYPWAPATLHQIVFAKIDNDIYVTFPGMRPKVFLWDGDEDWRFDTFEFRTTGSNHQRAPYTRIARADITLQPGGTTGTQSLTFSEAYLDPLHVGSRIRYQGKQIEILTVTSPTTGTGAIIETLLGGQQLDFPGAVNTVWNVGTIIVQPNTGARGEITAFPVADQVRVTLLTTQQFLLSGGPVIGPIGETTIDAITNLPSPPASTTWDEEVMSDFRGWPRSCFADQSRLGFCDFPSVPAGIAWSEVGIYNDFEPGATATNAIFEFVPNRARVYHVVGGNDEYIFTDQDVRYIPISEGNPLQPGSIAFRQIAGDPASDVRPVDTAESVLFVNGSKTRIMAIIATGQTAKPYLVRDVTELHSHLLNTPKAIASSAGYGNVPERYVYVLNTDGTLMVGRYNPAKEWVGWLPWTAGGGGEFTWVSALASTVVLTTTYTVNAVERSVVETIDTSAYLDAQVTLNSIPTYLAQTLGSVGTNIGNMTDGTGLGAAFDGIVGTANGRCTRLAANGFVGKNFATPQRIASTIVYPSADTGFANGGAGDVTITLRGKATAPNADGSDGTVLGTATLTTDPTTQAISIPSGDSVTAWEYVWVRVSQGGAGRVDFAEVEFFNPSAADLLWPFAGGTVKLMNGRKYLGERAVTAWGVVTPNEGEDLSVAALVAGFGWEAMIEPFVPHAGGGSVPAGMDGQTLAKRNIGQVAVTVQNSTGFAIKKLDETLLRREPPYAQGDNVDDPPPLRETTYTSPIPGADFDPRILVVKDEPGPLRILEIGIKVEV